MTYPSFLAGDILTATDMNAVGMWLVKTQAVGTGVTTQQVTNAFSSNYDFYRIVLLGIDSNTNGNGMKLKLDGITSAVYSSSNIYNEYGATVTGSGYVNDAGGILIGFTGLNDDSYCVVDIYGPSLARRKTYTFQSCTGAYYMSGGGYINSTSTATGFTIDPDGAATMTGGTIRVYGYRN